MNRLTYGTNLQTSQVMLATTVLSMRVAILVVERDRDKERNFQLF